MTPNRFPTPCVEFRPRFTLSNHENPSFYWSHVLKHTLNGIPALGLPRLKGAILAGPPGNGRHTTAEALSGTLNQGDIHYFLRISGATLDTEDVADACAALEGAMAKFRSHPQICLLLDGPENSRHSLAIQEYLLQQLTDRAGKLFLILITDSTANITPNLQLELTTCQFRRPDLATRQQWLQSQMAGKVPIKIDGMNYISLTKATDGFTWRQLTDLRTLLRRSVAMKYHENSEKYAAAGTSDQLFRKGDVQLSKEEVFAALAFIRDQGAPAMPAAVPAAAVQYVAAPGVSAVNVAAAAAPAAAPAAQATPAAAPPPASRVMTQEEKERAKQELEFRRHPEKMSFNQLIDVDGL